MTNKKKFYLFIIIFIIAFNLRPAITSIGPLIVPIREQLGLSNQQVSLLTAIPIICMGIFAVLTPLFVERFGMRRSMASMLLLLLIATASRGIQNSFTILLLTAFLAGISIAVIGPLLSMIIKQFFSDHAGRAIGLYSFAMGIGASVSAGGSVHLYEQSASISFALGSWGIWVLLALICWLFLQLDKDKKQQIRHESFTNTNSPWKNKRAWLFLLFFGFQSSAFFAIVTWLAPIATDASMSVVQAGMMVSLMTTIQLIVNLIFPLIIERFPNRFAWLVIFLTIGLVGIGFIWTQIQSFMWVAAIFLGLPLGALFPISLLLPVEETSSAFEANRWTAMMQGGGFTMASILTYLIGLLYDKTNNFNLTLLLFALLFGVLLCLSYILYNDERTKNRKQQKTVES